MAHHFDWLSAAVAVPAYNSASGNTELVWIYKACIEASESKRISASRSECTARISAYLVSIALCAAGVGYLIGMASTPGLLEDWMHISPPEARRISILVVVTILFAVFAVLCRHRDLLSQPTALARVLGWLLGAQPLPGRPVR